MPDQDLVSAISNRQTINDICAFQCLYLAKTLQNFRQSIPKHLLAEGDATKIKIGLIGCGHMGSAILRALVHSGCFEPSQISVSTRRPALLSKYSSLGVTCVADNPLVATTSDLLFLCCSPQNISHIVVPEIRANLKPFACVCSVAAGLTRAKLSQLLKIETCIRTQIDVSATSFQEACKIWPITDVSLSEPTYIEPAVPTDVNFLESLFECLCLSGSHNKKKAKPSIIKVVIPHVFGVSCTEGTHYELPSASDREDMSFSQLFQHVYESMKAKGASAEAMFSSNFVSVTRC